MTEDVLARLKQALQDRYTIEREIGSGGMATVYLAQDIRHGRPVAVKVLRPELAAALGPDRFLQEIKIAANLTHPHILPLHDSGESHGFLYYVMPYIQGESLRTKLVKQGELPIAEAVRILRDVVDALTEAHSHGVVHRDIKPENVMLRGNHALVTDFGVAKAVSEATGRHKLTTEGVALGTPAYMSPEQAAADSHIDHRADIYAVGALAYELLTGRPPFAGVTPQEVLAAHVTQAPEPVTKHRETVPPALAQLVMKCLEKKAADRWQTAGELLPQLEALTTPSGGITPTETQPIRAPIQWNARRTVVAAVAVLVLAILALVVLLPSDRPAIDPDVIAVAPFDVLDAELEMWREGLADVLAGTLDGAGPLRTAPTAAVIRRWGGRADAAAALDLGRELGAGLVLYGRLLAAGRDSVRLTATLFDVAANTATGDFEVRDVEDRIDRLSDALALQVVEALARTRGMGVWNLSSLGSSSPAAVRAFLQGEQEFRGFNLDSAHIHYERAIALDSGFALAYNRLAEVLGWEVVVGTTALRLRAGELNSGLAPRESLIVVSDSLYAATGRFAADSASWSRLARLFTTLEQAVRRYPRDARLWSRLGEARYHLGAYTGVPDEDAFFAFRRAVELDSSFAPGYQHLIELTLRFEGALAAQRTVEAYLNNAAQAEEAEAMKVVSGLLEPERAQTPELQQQLESLSPGAFFDACYALRNWVDSAESVLRVARAWARVEPERGRDYLSLLLVYRGHVSEAVDEVGIDSPTRFAELAGMGLVSDQSFLAAFQSWVRENNLVTVYQSLRWFLQRGDTASLSRLASVWDSAYAVATARGRGDLMDYARQANRAYLDLARGDTLRALGRLTQLPDLPAGGTYHERWVRARLLAADGDDRGAAELLRQMPMSIAHWPHPERVLWAFERAQVNDRLGNRDQAIEDYSFVVDVWRTADPELQPVVEQARAALVRLAGEPQR